MKKKNRPEWHGWVLTERCQPGRQGMFPQGKPTLPTLRLAQTSTGLQMARARLVDEEPSGGGGYAGGAEEDAGEPEEALLG